ncbi:S1C family serine protease, partial [Rhodopirellula bahusiensis]
MSAVKRSIIVVLAVMNLSLLLMVAASLFLRPVLTKRSDSSTASDQPIAVSGVRDGASQEVPVHAPTAGNLADTETRTIELFRVTSPSVVHITTSKVARDYFSMNVQEIPQGSGTGFVWDKAGHIVTNNHVIQNADVAMVAFDDQTSYPAKLVGVAPDKDLAVLLIDAPAERLRPIPRGVSADLEVGRTALAIGNPFGLDQTLTTGVISALGREIKSDSGVPIKDVIQTDAAINPGNSGGPLLDRSGQLIGVNTAIYSPSGAYAGIGFAIPVDTVRWVVP